MEKNEIYKIYGENYKEMTETLLGKIDAAALIPDRHAFIGIKPNLVSDSTAEWGATTHPEIVAGIIEYLKDNGFDNLVMLEGSWVGSRTSDVYQLCGYKKLSERYGVPFMDMQKDSYETIERAGFKMAICKTALKLDFLINVPVLKGHGQTRVTCALKNMKGLISNQEKRHFHAQGLHRPIAALNAVIHQDLIIVDNICGDLDFEDGGNPVVRNCIMAARDPVLCDAYACRLMHTEVSRVPYIGMAQSLGVGSTDLEDARICIIKETERWKEAALPFSNKVVSLQDRIEDVDSCSACYGYLLPALQKLRDDGLLARLHTPICIGQGYKGKTGVLGVGNCTRLFETYVRGCPPTENQIYKTLKAYIESH